MRQHLLCGSCEQRLNPSETYVARLAYKQQDPAHIPDSRPRILFDAHLPPEPRGLYVSTDSG